MTIVGVDTSNHDVARNGGRTLDYAAMHRDGIRFGWHKVSDGLRYYRDPTAAAALAAMRAALDVWGGYHVLWPGQSITGQIDWHFSILDQIAPGWRTDPKFVVVLDCEPFGYNGGAPSIGQVNAAGDYVLAKVGKRVGGYCPPWVYGAKLDGLRYPLISSNYGSNPADWWPRTLPADTSGRWQATPRRQADVLQYGSRGVAGPHNTLDVDAYRGGLAELTTLFSPSAATGSQFSTGDDLVGVLIAGEPIEQYFPRIERALLWQIPGIANTVQTVKAQLDVSATREQAALDALKALATVGGADIAPAVNAINAVGAKAEEQFTALHGQIADLTAANADLQRRLEAAAAALAKAGAAVPAEVANASIATT